MFLLKSRSDVCGWPATTYTSLYYHGNWGGRMQAACRKLGEVMACCLIAAIQQTALSLRLSVCRLTLLCIPASAPICWAGRVNIHKCVFTQIYRLIFVSRVPTAGWNALDIVGFEFKADPVWRCRILFPPPICLLKCFLFLFSFIFL